MRQVVVAVVVICLLASPQNAEAGYAPGTGHVDVGGSDLDASAQIQGMLSGGRPGNWRNPCVGYENAALWQRAKHWPVDPFIGTSEDLKVFPAGERHASAIQRTVDGVTLWAGLSVTTCKWAPKDPKATPPDESPWFGAKSFVGAYWYPIRPEPRVLIPPMFQMVRKQIGEPVLSWPNMNKDKDKMWVYVVLPMAYQLDPIGHVRATASVENELGPASAWIQATPTRVDVESDGYSSSCLIGDATEDHGTDEDPPCAVIWERVGRDVPVTVTLTWTITSSVPGADIPDTVTTVTDTTINVSEIQALVEQ